MLALLGMLRIAGAAPPADVSVQGVLEDVAGQPLSGARDWRVQFYEGPTNDTPIGGNLVGSTTLDDRGRFSFSVVLPAGALDAADLHYELAIDTSAPANGIDSNDVFPDLVRVTSVPFARRAATSDDAAALGGLAPSHFSPRTHGAIVDASGGGDYATIQSAILAGEKSIFVRNGSYTLTADVAIPAAPFSLVGESPDGVLINCASNHSLVFAGDTAVYLVGGVSVTNGSTLVTSVSGSPAWLTNVAAGDVLRIGRTFHEVASVTSDTTLNLVSAYQGMTFASVNYSSATFGRGFHFRNLTFLDPPDASNTNQNATQGAICLRFARDISIENCRSRLVGAAFGHLANIENCHNATITDCQIDGGGLINMANSAIIALRGNLLRNARARAIFLAARSDDEPNFDIIVQGNVVSGGTGNGAIFVSQASLGSVSSITIADNMISAWDGGLASTSGAIVVGTVSGSLVITGNTIDRGNGNGLAFTNTGTTNVTITGNAILNNTGWGIREAAAGILQNAVVVSNVLIGNTAGAINTSSSTYGTLNVPAYEVPVP
jgi:hypothetical protein